MGRKQEGDNQNVFKDETITEGEAAERGRESTLGLDENIASLLTYLGTIVTAIIFIIIEKENKVVRFHAFQSLFTFSSVFILNIIITFTIGLIPIIGMLVMLVLWLGSMGLWVFLMYKAFQAEKFLVPIVGELAEKQVEK